MSEYSNYQAGLWLPDEKPAYGTPLNPLHQLNHGLICYLPFNEAGGNKAFDLSGNQNHGTLHNFGTGYGWQPSKRGVGLKFDGTDDYVDCGNGANLNNLETFTLSAWIYLNGWGGNGLGRILDKTSLTGSGSYIFYVNNNSYFYFEAARWQTTHGQWKSPANSIALNQWYHVAMTYDYSSTTNNPIFYINGNSVTATETATPAGTTASETELLYVGNRADTLRSFDGQIDQVRIDNRALSAEEISQLYHYQYVGFQQPCEAWLYAAAAGGLSIPIAMHHYNALRV